MSAAKVETAMNAAQPSIGTGFARTYWNLVIMAVTKSISRSSSSGSASTVIM